MDMRLPHRTSQRQPERQGFNLSRWAIEHTNFTRFLLVLVLSAGVFAFTNLGQKEDPDFTFRVMTVQVLWPGSSVHEMQEQVVDKIERKIQETPQLDFVQSYTHPGSAVIFVNLKGEARGREVSDAFYQVRKKVGDIQNTLPSGVLGPFFNDEFGDTYLALYALSGNGFTYPELLYSAPDVKHDPANHNSARPTVKRGGHQSFLCSAEVIPSPRPCTNLCCRAQEGSRMAQPPPKVACP